MPNHVTNKILFAADKADEVFSVIRSEDHFDFGKLVPTPPNMYHGNLSASDDKDFPINWNTWSRENWGTKWNAYGCSFGIEGDRAFVKFDTAWSPPWPVMAAFCNRFQIPFEHRYFDEGDNFWGIDIWSVGQWPGDSLQRSAKNFKREEDHKPLALELKGRDDAWYAELNAESEEEIRG